MVDRRTRSERIKENRANRMKRAADIVEGKGIYRKYKKSKTQQDDYFCYFDILGILLYLFFK